MLTVSNKYILLQYLRRFTKLITYYSYLPKNLHFKMSEKESKNKKKEVKVPIVIKNATDLQRLKLDKLMKNPEKPVVLPLRPKEKTLAAAPDFVRNVMGSSAGAGSGEFHVYRHLRRKEYARQKFIQEKSEQEKKDEEYHIKIEENKKAAEERTAKKRAKRLKKKKNAKLRAKKPKVDANNMEASSQSGTSSEEENEHEIIVGVADDCTKADKNNLTKNIENRESSCISQNVDSEVIETVKNYE